MEYCIYDDEVFDMLVVFVLEGEEKKTLEALPELFAKPVQTELYEQHYKAKRNATMVLYTEGGCAKSVLFVGLGAKPKEGNFAQLRKNIRLATGIALSHAKKQHFSQIAFFQNMPVVKEEFFEKREAFYEDVACAALVASYKFSLKQQREEDVSPKVVLLTCEKHAQEDIKKAVHYGVKVGEATNYVRRLVDMPANMADALFLEKMAKDVASEHGLTLKVLRKEDMEKLGMGAFLAVAQGSAKEPRLLCLEYTPKGKEQDKPVAIVGKGLTFDSGGISIKPSSGMHEMKADMAGAATTLGLATLAPYLLQRRMVFVLACAENMPSGSATRPGDIVTSMSGKTIEILNTDAEGRLVLCDALTWVQKEYDPSLIVDMATLTGACAMALGEEITGIFTEHEALCTHFCRCGMRVGEPMWQLPLLPEYFLEDIKSNVADLQNIGKKRFAGATTAALFLAQFIENERPWIHLDIAGVAYSGLKNALYPDGGSTGMPMRAVLTALEHLSEL